MKLKYFLTIAAAAVLTTACDMDLAPKGSLDEKVAIQTEQDAKQFRNGLYRSVRAVSSSQFLTATDIQTDMFNGITINGNRLGNFANGTIVSSESEIYDYWSAMYSLIAQTNYFFEYGEPVREKLEAEGNEEAADKVALYLAEAHFIRGYYYAMMFNRWCVEYEPAKGDTPGMGLPIVTVFNPTADRSKYPGRSTMNETLKFFNAEIQLGYDGIKAYEDKYPAEVAQERLSANACYISSWACKAMQARIALWMNDWAKAQSIAEEVINCKLYSLATTSTYKAMWTDDRSTEIIFMPFESTDELGNAIGNTWLNNGQGADYILSATFLKELMAAGMTTGMVKKYKDVRFDAFVLDKQLITPYGNILAPCFNKFPGNKALQTTGESNYVNKPKVFRLSEMYFIAAEAAYNQGDENKANSLMQTYMKNRINYSANEGYEALSGIALQEFIHTQKSIEFAGEGFRMSDLRRWKMGFNRYNGENYDINSKADYTGVSQILTPAGLEVEYSTTDYRYTWPIPASEINANPQIKGQQNPGYGN
ncbi:MAG: RagB/SusD family nutrient uptake outer membrane protein [Muribaculaceae bacterium]|nr:RagB/SusD family nutrient uptake outer membrane protein [Muribaculaceae bacterium]